MAINAMIGVEAFFWQLLPNITQLFQQQFKLIGAAMNVANNIEGAMFILAIVPQRLTLDFGRRNFLDDSRNGGIPLF